MGFHGNIPTPSRAGHAEVVEGKLSDEDREPFEEEVSDMKQRKWSIDEKLAIVLEGLKEKSPVRVYLPEHNISLIF